MTGPTEDIDAEQFLALREALRYREQTIIDRMLQTPDYPPLPPCPHCDGTAEEISVSETLHHEDVISFRPCGHQFLLGLQAKLDMPL